MKAIILNSGTGSRMGSFTESSPKCLVEIGDTTILGLQLSSLIEMGFKDVIITTGPFAEKIKRYIGDNFPGLNVTYVHNPKYDETNYIYSLYLARDQIDDDVILMHGDMVYDPVILERLLSNRGNGVLVNRESEQPEKDFKGRIQDGLVTEISVKIFDDNCFELMPVYKVSEQAMGMWLDKIAEFVENNNVNVYAENALNEISKQIEIEPVLYTEFCMEIDTPEDLETAKEFFR